MKVPSASSMDYSPNTSNSRSREPTVRTTDEMTEISPASPQRGRRQRGPSQKAMLSKALQMANTAVLLDNAANFEGAIDAYNEACQLLQLVMVRSNGSEDEKTKLLEIVRNIHITDAIKLYLSDSRRRSKTLIRFESKNCGASTFLYSNLMIRLCPRDPLAISLSLRTCLNQYKIIMKTMR